MTKVHTWIKLLEECDAKPGCWHSRMVHSRMVSHICMFYPGGWRQEDEHEVEASLVQIASSRSIGQCSETLL